MQVGAGDAVDRRVVHLGDEADLAVVEALDEPQLPQRPAAVERAAGDVADDLGQLVHRARRRHGDAVEVGVEVEVGVLDPHRMAEVERHRHQPAAERLEQVQPAVAAGARPARTRSPSARPSGRG